MQLFKSLFCLKGADNNERFIIIGGFSIALVMFMQLAASTSIVLNSIMTLLLVVVFALSSLRRQKDAQSHLGFAIAAIASFVLFCAAMLVLESGARYLSLIWPILPVLYLYALPSQSNRKYLYGYNGPVDLSALVAEPIALSNPRGQRIEPSLFGEASADSADEFAAFSPSQSGAVTSAEYADDSTHTVSALSALAQPLYQWLYKFARIALIAYFVAALAVLISLIVSLPEPMPTEPVAEQIEETQDIAHAAKTPVRREHYLEMPDDFYLFLDNYRGLVVHWKADMTDNGEIWSLATATGDDTCSVIEFNRGDKVRTVSVVIENTGDYFANFSPLDTQEIVSLLAKRGNFSLCGYTFSLKGSQKALNSNPAYIDYAN